MSVPSCNATQRLPSAPATTSPGSPPVAATSQLNSPDGVTRWILPLPVNHTFPSVPAPIPPALRPGGTSNTVVAPAGVVRLIQ
jgi:hypothetical protein